MSIKSLFFNAVESGGVYDRIYNSEDFTAYLGSLVKNGVFANPSTTFQVASSNGMNVKVKPGKAWIEGHLMIMDANATVALDSAHSSLPRWDGISLFLDYDNRTMTCSYVKGTAASAPSVPALTRNAHKYELRLANIYVTPGMTTVANAQIYDVRPDATVCGWVSGMINQVDVTTLFQQYTAAYEQQLEDMNNYIMEKETQMTSWMTSMQNQFESWLALLTDELLVETYIQEYSKTVTAVLTEPVEVTLDMEGYAYDSSDVILVFINGLKAVRGVDYSVFVASQTRLIFSMSTGAPYEQTISITVLKSKVGFNTMITNDDDDVIDSDNDDLEI